MAVLIDGHVQLRARVGIAEGRQVRVPAAHKAELLHLGQGGVGAGGIIHVLQAEQGDHVIERLLIRVGVKGGAEPVGVRAGQVALQLLQVLSVAELQVIRGLHGVVPEEEVVELPGFVRAFVYVAGECHRDLLAHVHHGLSLADVILAQIFIGVGLGRSVSLFRRDLISLHGHGLQAVDEPAVKLFAVAAAEGFDGGFAVEVGTDGGLQAVHDRVGVLLTDHGAAVVRPDASAAVIQDDLKQIDVGHAVFAGDRRKDAGSGGSLRRFAEGKAFGAEDQNQGKGNRQDLFHGYSSFLSFVSYG